MAHEPVVALESLSKRFGDVQAVDGVDLAVPRGQAFGLLGPNGAGKTTTLRLLLGLVRPSSGRARLFGEPVSAGCPQLRRVGALVEQPGFVPHLSGMENLRLFWAAGGDPPEAARFEQALELADLGDALHRRYKTYSHGMRQRLALAQALLGSPELLVLDEPTTGLDPQQMREVRQLIRRVSAAGTTVLLSSHLLSEVEQVCSHVAVMNRGRLVVSGPVEEVTSTRNAVYVEVDDPARARQILAGLDYVAGVEAEGAGLSVDLRRPGRAGLVAALVGGGVGVETVEARHRLEDAFLGLLEQQQ